MPLSKEMLDRAAAAAAKIDMDVFLFNGGVARGRDLECIEHAFRQKARNRALLVPVTNGGDPDAAYKVARYLQDKYDNFTALISGLCKSAGTLMALGATELAFTPFGELGPLDIQLSKVDRFDQLQSGLTIDEALTTLEERALHTFYQITRDYIQANNGMVSFATASKASAEFVAQLYAPVFSRLDPEEIGARSRSMRIAAEYGKRLAVKSQNLKPDTLKQLAETYPSHSFAIDQREAEILFHRVRAASPEEQELVTAIGNYARFERGGSEFVFRALSSPPKTKGKTDAKDLGRGSPPPTGRDSPRANGASDPSAKPPRRPRRAPVPKPGPRADA
jgi:hypothetical protein